MSTPVVEPHPFDFAAHKQAKNEAEAAQRAGKPAPEPPKPEVKVEPEPQKPEPGPEPPKKEEKQPEIKVEPAKEPPEPAQPHVPRSIRRQINQLQRQLGEAEGRAAMLQELIDRGMSSGGAKAAVAAAEPPAEPKREDFLNDADYLKASARHIAREEAQAAAAAQAKQAEEAKQAEQFKDRVRAAEEAMAKQIEALPDWEDAVEANAELHYDSEKDANFLGMLLTSEDKGLLLYHFAQKPEDYKRLIDMRDDIGAQAKAFGRLEERVERLYIKPVEKPPEKVAVKEPEKVPEKKPEPEPIKPASPTAAERDAAKAKPSESIAPRGGMPTSGDIEMLMPDGRTLNPAWIAARNAKDGLRR